MPIREACTGPDIMNRGSPIAHRVLRRLLVTVFAVLAAGGTLFFALGVHEAYPLLYRRELNAVLGQGRWRVSGGKTMHPYAMRDGDPKSYRQWTIHYTAADDCDYEFAVNNYRYRLSRARRRIWGNADIGKRLDFAMNLHDFIEQYAAQQVERDVVAHIFDPADYASPLPSLSDHGVGMHTAVKHTADFAHNDYLRAVNPTDGYNLQDFVVGDLLAQGEQYIQVTIRTWAATEETVVDIDRKATQLRDVLIEQYAEHATFEIFVYHFREEEDYHSQNASRTQFYTVQNGQTMAEEEL